MGFIPTSFRSAIYEHLKGIRKVAIECKFDGRKLRRYGFVKTIKHYGRVVYVSKRFGVVIKFPYMTQFNIPSTHCIPTLFVSNPKYRGGFASTGKFAVIQPLVSTKNKMSAMRKLEQIGAYLEVGDFHSENVGWYGKYPVMFDW